MAHLLQSIAGVRYIGDTRTSVVHDRWHENCEDCLVKELVKKGVAVGFDPDTLGQALTERFDYCDWCVDRSDPEPPTDRNAS